MQGQSTPSFDSAELAQAVAEGSVDRVEAIVEATDRLPDETLLRAAELGMKHQRWRLAAVCYDRLERADASVGLKRNLARNLASIGEHRPALHDLLCQAPGSDRYQPAMAENGQMTLLYRCDAGRWISLGSRQDPAGQARRLVDQIEGPCKQGEPLTLCGVGDGYALRRLAQDPPELPLGMELPVYVIEPDSAAVLAVLLLHDLSGPSGPIEQHRFRWFVGPGWSGDLSRTLREDLFLPRCSVTIRQSVDAQAIVHGIQQANDAREAIDRAYREQAHAHCAGLTREDLVELLGPNPPRSPRLLVATSRFTTVLQHSCRDIQKAFERMGWRTELLIEPEPYHRLSSRETFRRAVAEWKPDLVFVIDHLRHEHGDIVPSNLPFVCWIQDHLPDLTTAEAGRQITARDFVLTSISPLYTSLYEYPRRQCIGISKLTHIPERPVRWASDGDDLTYVSHASEPPERIIEQLEAENQESPEGQWILRRCSRRLCELYERGESVATLYEMGELVDGLLAEAGRVLRSPSIRYTIIQKLFYRLNNALYRQQALAWAADAAQSLGLSLAVYGNGWDGHPRFAPYARGPIAYGRDLEEVTRRTRINLQIVPYFCLHQRLLDGLAAGGFFLVRHHPSDELLPAFARFLDAHFDPEIQTLEQARRAADSSLRERLNRELKRCRVMTDLGVPVDLVQWVRECQAARLLDGGDRALPRLDEVSYSDEEGLRRRLERFVHSDELRAEIAAAQRASVEHRLSYEAGMQRTVRRIRELLAHEPEDARIDAG